MTVLVKTDRHDKIIKRGYEGAGIDCMLRWRRQVVDDDEILWAVQNTLIQCLRLSCSSPPCFQLVSTSDGRDVDGFEDSAERRHARVLVSVLGPCWLTRRSRSDVWAEDAEGARRSPYCSELPTRNRPIVHIRVQKSAIAPITNCPGS